jgi:hypothetical protein
MPASGLQSAADHPIRPTGLEDLASVERPALGVSLLLDDSVDTWK